MYEAKRTAKPTVALVHREEVPGNPAEYSEKDLAVVRGMVKEAVDALGGITAIVKPGDRVLVKPNIVWPIPAEYGFTTDPRIVEAVVRMVREETEAGEIVVADRTAVGRRTEDAFEASGIGAAALRAGADRILPLEDDSRIPVRIPRARALMGEIGLPRVLFDSDAIIYLPKMKTHKQATVSLSMKLSQGVLAWSDMIQCHRYDIEQKFVDLLRVVKPHLSIIDALWAMQGQGPGSPFSRDLIKDMNLVIAGTDPVAVDAVSAAAMGFDPLPEVGMIRAATLEGLGQGDLAQIEVSGSSIANVKRFFRRASDSLIGLHPKIEIYAGGACKGCAGFTRTGLDPLLSDLDILADGPKRLESVERITCILGFKTNVPETLVHDPPRRYVFVIGDCTAEHKDKGIFLPGCASLGVHEMIDNFGLDDQESQALFWKYQPRGYVA